MIFSDGYIESVLTVLNQWPTLATCGLMLVFCFASILGLFWFLGRAGLYVYIATAVVAANIMVLKAVSFPFFGEPVALGTIVFTSTFLCTDILCEYYGPKDATRGVLYGFVAMLMMTGFMLLTIAIRPLGVAEAGDDLAWAVENHDHIKAIFLPAPALFLAGTIAYVISQLHDVWLFSWLRSKTQGKYLWLRNNVSTCLSSFLDNVIFSVLAWIVFADSPLPWKTVWWTYIVGTFMFRIVIALLDTPIVYAARYGLRKRK